ncbi:protein YgfX [Saccharospirillum sp.]|uniref:protein YgfX n=1 Tax=Saccharospirillum sp. TaxID=2033801 RepID=UPI0034A0A31A
MSNPIECQLQPSRLRWLMMSAPPVICLILLGFSALPLWFLGALTLVLGVVLVHGILAEPQPRYLRWAGADVWLYDQLTSAKAEQYQWQGGGRRNALYIRLALICVDTGYRRDLMIWRDSVTDPSWRSLNAWFRIQASSLRRDPSNL